MLNYYIPAFSFLLFSNSVLLLLRSSVLGLGKLGELLAARHEHVFVHCWRAGNVSQNH